MPLIAKKDMKSVSSHNEWHLQLSEELNSQETLRLKKTQNEEPDRLAGLRLFDKMVNRRQPDLSRNYWSCMLFQLPNSNVWFDVHGCPARPTFELLRCVIKKRLSIPDGQSIKPSCKLPLYLKRSEFSINGWLLLLSFYHLSLKGWVSLQH